MAGTKAGGIKAAATNKQRYGMNFYEQIGRKGGTLSSGGGFAKNRELADATDGGDGESPVQNGVGGEHATSSAAPRQGSRLLN